MGNEMKRITIFVMHGDDNTDYKAAMAWFERWRDQVIEVEYSSGGWEHLWDVEASVEAIADLPKDFLCDSEWRNLTPFKK
jgi:hypothetical protein